MIIFIFPSLFRFSFCLLSPLLLHLPFPCILVRPIIQLRLLANDNLVKQEEVDDDDVKGDERAEESTKGNVVHRLYSGFTDVVASEEGNDRMPTARQQ